MNCFRKEHGDAQILKIKGIPCAISKVPRYVQFQEMKLSLSMHNQMNAFKLKHFLGPISLRLKGARILVEYFINNKFDTGDFLCILIHLNKERLQIFNSFNVKFTVVNRNQDIDRTLSF